MQSFIELADGPMFLEGGGQLIRDTDGEVIGAIATTGDTNEVDDLCVIAGIRAAGFKTDQDFGEDVVVLHAGTKRDAEGGLRAAGGRVLNVCARGATLVEARERAYAAIDAIDFPDGFCRRDIGWRALGR